MTFRQRTVGVGEGICRTEEMDDHHWMRWLWLDHRHVWGVCGDVNILVVREDPTDDGRGGGAGVLGVERDDQQGREV